MDIRVHQDLDNRYAFTFPPSQCLKLPYEAQSVRGLGILHRLGAYGTGTRTASYDCREKGMDKAGSAQEGHYRHIPIIGLLKGTTGRDTRAGWDHFRITLHILWATFQ